MRKSSSIPALALLCAAAVVAQPTALPPAQEVLRLCDRVVQLMDSTKVTVPELARAGEPVAENARQALINLRAAGAQNSPLIYTFLSNLRAYLALSDSVPKPSAMTDEGRRQFYELRDAQDRLDAYFRALLARKEEQLREPDRDALGRYAEANRKLAPPLAGKPRVVFLGDSITDMWRLNEYFSGDRDFVNRGIGGQITGQMLGRMMADVISLKPAAVLVLAGTNDIARGVPLEAVQNNLTMIAALAEAHKIAPLFASLLPVSDYHKDQNPAYLQTLRRPPQTIRALNAWLQEFCRQRNYVYVDYYSRLVDSAGFLQADLSDDGLHPNSKGYRVMAPVALEAIDKVLQPPVQRKRGR
jgi:lysophospholipase L1-like esterase